MKTYLAHLAVLMAGTLLVMGCRRDQPAEYDATVVEETVVQTEPAAAETEATTRVRVQTIIDQVVLHIRNGQFDAAETGLRQLEAETTNLPPDLVTQIETARASLQAAQMGAATGSPTQAPVSPLPGAGQ